MQLREAEYEALKELAHRTRRSMAECVREGVELLLRHDSERKRMDFRKVAGKFSEIPADDLKPHDRWWAESIR